MEFRPQNLSGSDITLCEDMSPKSKSTGIGGWRFLASISGSGTLFFRRTQTSLGFRNVIRKLWYCKLELPYKLIRQFEASILVKSWLEQ